jgi:signal transduction histidine kinase
VEAAIAASGLAIENTRLHAVLRDQLNRVRASRAKVVAAGLEERRRIERDLHDGAQQHLLALAAWLGLARSQAQAEAPGTVEAVDEARGLLQDTLRELRRLARGIHPAVLGPEGLEAALDSAAQTLPMLVDVEAPKERFDPTAETVAYLTAWDALTYLARAGDAGPATVRIRREGTDLWVHVAFEDLTERDHARAVALDVIRDRLRAFDGGLRLDQSDDGGCQLTARIPCNDAPREPRSPGSSGPASTI